MKNLQLPVFSSSFMPYDDARDEKSLPILFQEKKKGDKQSKERERERDKTVVWKMVI